MIESKIFKNGNSLGLYIPANYAKAIGIEKGDSVQLDFNPIDREIVVKLKKEASIYDSEEFQNAVKDAVEKALQEREKNL